MLETNLEKLLAYGRDKGFFEDQDSRYVRNRLLEILRYPEYRGVPKGANDLPLAEILDPIFRWAAEKGRIQENTPLYRDLLEAALMGAMLPRPSQVGDRFFAEYRKSPAKATDYLYQLSIDANYIRKSRTDQNVSWYYKSPYGVMEITINVSKPEKSVQEIEAATKAPPGPYPPCLLCAENEGYSGRLNHPPRQNLRLIPLTLAGEPWYFQYSPYLYYNEHCIALNEIHTPMVINQQTLAKMMDFLDILPHYFIGSNADLPVVGGSILSHDHFQGGKHRFPMDGAKEVRKYSLPHSGEVEAALLHWPLSALRLTSPKKEGLLTAGGQLIRHWQGYRDEAAGIFPASGPEPHNTITPIARRQGGCYQLDLVLRNNRRDEQHPEGIFHPHREIHNIKKENIGLIEVMGLAVLPARLLTEMQLMRRYLLQEDLSLADGKTLAPHLPLCAEIKALHKNINGTNVDSILQDAVGEKFVLALTHAGVFKEDASGRQSFSAFINSMGWQELP